MDQKQVLRQVDFLHYRPLAAYPSVAFCSRVVPPLHQRGAEADLRRIFNLISCLSSHKIVELIVLHTEFSNQAKNKILIYWVGAPKLQQKKPQTNRSPDVDNFATHLAMYISENHVETYDFVILQPYISSG